MEHTCQEADPAARDELLRRVVSEQLAALSQWLDVSDVHFHARDGVILLQGELDARAEAERLVWELIRLPGVSDVAMTDLRFRDEQSPYLDPNHPGFAP